MNLHIKIEYKLIDSLEWNKIEISPEQYFDLDILDEDEKLVWNSIPKYNQAIEYLDTLLIYVSNTRIIINDNESEIKRVITTTFWNNGQNQVVERVDKGTKISSYLMITTTKLQEEPSVWEIMRLTKTNDVLKINFHSFIRDNEDGSQTEKKVFPNEA